VKNNYSKLLVLLLVAVITNRGYAQNSAACKLDSIIRDTSAFVIWSPDSSKYCINKQDTAGIYQIYVGYKGSKNPPVCISNFDTTGNYPLASCWWWVRHWQQRNKLQVRWDPTGKWIVCVVERECYNELTYTPYSLLLTLLETGWKMDMWATTPKGDHWYQLDSATSSQGNGVVGPVFTPDGKKAVWAQLQDTSKSTDKFGLWYMMLSDFVDTGKTAPAFISTKNINPPGSRWIEPGNFAPDGQRLMISSDIGMPDAEGQDQFIFNIYTGTTINLTNSPKVWDEHGVFSPDGKKIIFMSSYPYRSDTNTYHTLSLKTEFMLIDASVLPGDSAYYPGLEQLTHFNVPGYVESDTAGVVAAAGGWSADGTRFYGQDLIAPSYDNWIILFKGNCGDNVTGVNEVQTIAPTITVFPNPLDGQTIYIKFEQVPQSMANIKVLDVTGREISNIKTMVSNNKTVPIDAGNLAPGMYFVKIMVAQSTSVVKFIKQ
jgi:Tol biopolymer transport system component